jgi:hypothetical protein
MGSDEGCVRKLRGQNHACTDRAGDNDAAETPIPRQHIAKQRGRGSVHELKLGHRQRWISVSPRFNII